MKLILTICLLALSLGTFSQVNKVEISEPIDLPKFGWNKVLMMKNGNTVLFHFEQRKPILVKVFDKDHKEIASQKTLTKMLDLNILEKTFLNEVTEVNGQAVLFITQDIENKNTLLRITFDVVSGKMVSEEKVVQAKSFSKKIIPVVLKSQNADDYSIFVFRDLEDDFKAEMKLEKYDAAHQVVKEIPLGIEKGEYDYVKFVGAGVNKQGGMHITILYSKIVKFPDVLDREIVIYYLAPGLDQFISKKIKMPSGLYPRITEFTYNTFSNNLNFLLEGTSVLDVDYKKAKNIDFYPIFLISKDDMSNLNSLLLKHTKANEIVKQKLDTSSVYNGSVSSMYTNERGLTTMVSENYGRQGFDGRLAITQYNDDGEELWATLIPFSHFNKEEAGPSVFYHEQNADLHRYSTLFSKSSTYVLFNDLDKNLENTSLKAEAIYTYSQTNGLFYKVDRKRELSKGYLFGAPTGDESKIACIGSSHFDDQNNIYASVIMHREGKKSTYKVAWCYLEP